MLCTTMWINDIWYNFGEEYVPNLKERARTRLRQAVAQGKIKKLPCEVCDYDVMGLVEGHHPDYRHALDVVWLCRKHHAELHRHIGYYEIAVDNDI